MLFSDYCCKFSFADLPKWTLVTEVCLTCPSMNIIFASPSAADTLHALHYKKKSGKGKRSLQLCGAVGMGRNCPLFICLVESFQLPLFCIAQDLCIAVTYRRDVGFLTIR